MLLHARAGLRGDVALEVAREEADDVGARPRGRRGAASPRGAMSGASASRSPPARAVEARLHRRHAEAGHPGHLGRGEPLDVAEEEHLAVGTVERRDRPLEGGLEAGGLERLVGTPGGVGEAAGRERASVSSETSAGANTLRRRFLMQKLRAIV